MSGGVVRGVDFGTSTSLVSESSTFEPTVIPLGTAETWLPSIVGVRGDEWYLSEEWYVCEDASVLPEEQIVRSVKRAITRKETTVPVSNGTSRVEVDADDVIVAILKSLGTTAQDNFLPLNERGSVRLGCPAIWTGLQRRRLIRLANEAGIAVGDNTLIDEPIAAGVAWISEMLRQDHDVKGKVLVFDMGGGTLDIAVLEVEARPGLDPAISVQSAVGLDEAGDSLDDLIAYDLEQKYLSKGFSVAESPHREDIRGWIRRAARHAKIELGTSRDVPVIVDYPGADLPVVQYSREELEEAFEPQLTRAMEAVWWALRAALMSQVASRSNAKTLRPSQARRMAPKELRAGVNHVLLAGGMAHVPAVLNRLAEHFSPESIYVGANGDPSQAIVVGLGEAKAYERLSLHRPGFDFTLTWDEPEAERRREMVVYQAYTPLYTFHSVIQLDSTKYRWEAPRDLLPRRGRGMLVVRSVSGQPINFRYHDREADGIEVEFGHSRPVLTLEPNGRVFLRDGIGREHVMRIAQWPVIRGVGFEAIEIEDIAEDARKIPELVWHQKESN